MPLSCGQCILPSEEQEIGLGKITIILQIYFKLVRNNNQIGFTSCRTVRDIEGDITKNTIHETNRESHSIEIENQSKK